MASNKTPSYSNGKLRLKIFSSSSSPSSPKVPATPSQSPPCGLTTMNTQKPSMISSLTPELQLFHEQVFKALPQTPHFHKLDNFTSESLKQGIKLGCDLAFINLVLKFQNLVDPCDFLTKVVNFTDEFKDFEELGYDLTKIKERFNLLKRRAEQEKELKDEVGRLDEEKKQREAELERKELRLMELTKEVKIERSEIESIDDKKKKIMDASNMSVDGFRNLASNPW